MDKALKYEDDFSAYLMFNNFDNSMEGIFIIFKKKAEISFRFTMTNEDGYQSYITLMIGSMYGDDGYRMSFWTSRLDGEIPPEDAENLRMFSQSFLKKWMDNIRIRFKIVEHCKTPMFYCGDSNNG